MSKVEDIQRIMPPSYDGTTDYTKEIMDVYPPLIRIPEYEDMFHQDLLFANEKCIVYFCDDKMYISGYLLYVPTKSSELDIAIINEDIPTLKYLILQGFYVVNRIVPLIVANIEIIRILLNRGLIEFTPKSYERLLEYMCTEAGIYRKTGKEVLLNQFVKHVELINWLSMNVLDFSVKPFTRTIRGYDGMTDCIVYFNFNCIMPFEISKWEYSYKYFKRYGDRIRWDKRLHMLESYTHDPDKFKILYNLCPTTPLNIPSYACLEVVKFLVETVHDPYSNYSVNIGLTWDEYDDMDKVYYFYIRPTAMRPVFEVVPEVLKLLMHERGVNDVRSLV